MSTKHWEQRRKVLRGLTLPTLPLGRRIWAIAMVKNEVDVIAALVEHIFTQDFDAMLIVDNGSTDGTLEVLRELAGRYPLFVGIDAEVGYFQDQKMSALGRAVRLAGAEWVVPVDADEFWFAAGMTVGAYLGRADSPRVEASIYNAFPTDKTPVLRGPSSGEVRIDQTAHKLPKVAARAVPLLWFFTGNHYALVPGDVTTGLFILHYPWRSFEQLRRKVRQGAVALRERGDDSDLGAHWHDQDAKSDDELTTTWHELLQGRASGDLGWAPVGPFTHTDPSSWRSWQLDADR
ncbi:glycosyltransferase family 2 protein [Pseudoclavibacter helvolus]|uniref:glycosyltransferase family 2 protein n=1 Tax=Pseudoclavibacter helvolus TaxID=255205 RepID=UPI003C796027